MSDSHYKAVLDDLRAKRKKLDELIANLESFAGGDITPAPPAQGQDKHAPSSGRPMGDTNIKADTFFGMNVPDAIKKYLEMKKRPEKAKDIARGLEAGGIMTQAKHFYANVSTALRRLEDAGDVVRIGDTKKWALASWYPNRPKTKPRNGATSDSATQGKDEQAQPTEGGGEEGVDGRLHVV